VPDKDHDVIQGPASGLTGNDRSALGEAASQHLHESWWLQGICKNTRLARPRGEWGCVVENKKGPPLGEPFLIRHQESKLTITICFSYIFYKLTSRYISKNILLKAPQPVTHARRSIKELPP